MAAGDFLEKIGFTPNEKKVIFFLLITLCCGGAVKIYRAVWETEALPTIDYGSVDREFAAKSTVPAATAASQQADGLSSRRGSGKKALPANASVDLNSATREDLMRLPGVGDATARAILLYRSNHGRFSSNEELMEVKGIGPKKFQKLKPYLHEL